MNSSGRSTKIKIPNYTDIISTRLQQIKSHKRVVEFRGNIIAKTLFYLYLLKKYSNNNICYILNRENLFLHRNFTWGLELLLGENDEKTQQFEKEYRQTCKILAARFVDCMKRACEFILVPVRIEFRKEGDEVTAHENIIIYKRALNKIEHVEPHGEFFNEENGLEHKRIQFLIRIFINEVNKAIRELKDGDIEQLKYEDTETTCPNNYGWKSLLGFQALEGYSQLERFPIEPKGYCLAWSMFMFEMGMLNPTLSNRKISDLITTYIKISQANAEQYAEQDSNSSDMVCDYLLELIRGYANLVLNKIRKYFSSLLDVDINEITMEENYNLIMKEIIDMMVMETHIEDNKGNYNIESERQKAIGWMDKSKAVLKEDPDNKLYKLKLKVSARKLILLDNHLQLNREVKNSPDIRALHAIELLPAFEIEVGSKPSKLVHDIFGSSSSSSSRSSNRSFNSSVKQLKILTHNAMKQASPPDVIEISSSESSHSSHGSKRRSKKHKKQSSPHKNVIDLTSSRSRTGGRARIRYSVKKRRK